MNTKKLCTIKCSQVNCNLTDREFKLVCINSPALIRGFHDNEMIGNVIIKADGSAFFGEMQMSEQRRFQWIGVKELGDIALVVAPDTQTTAIVVIVPDAIFQSVVGVSQLTLIVIGHFDGATTDDKAARIVSDRLGVVEGHDAITGVVAEKRRLLAVATGREDVAVVVVGVAVGFDVGRLHLEQTAFGVVGDGLRGAVGADGDAPGDDAVAMVVVELELESVVAFDVDERHGGASVGIAIGNAEVVLGRVLDDGAVEGVAVDAQVVDALQQAQVLIEAEGVRRQLAPVDLRLEQGQSPVAVVLAARFQVVQPRLAAELDLLLLEQAAVVFELVAHLEGPVAHVHALEQTRCRIVIEIRFGNACNDALQSRLVAVQVEDARVESARVDFGRDAALVVQHQVERVAVDGRVVDELGEGRHHLQGERVNVSARRRDGLHSADVVVADRETLPSFGGELPGQRRDGVFERVRQFRRRGLIAGGEDHFGQPTRAVVIVRFRQEALFPQRHLSETVVTDLDARESVSRRPAHRARHVVVGDVEQFGPIFHENRLGHRVAVVLDRHQVLAVDAHLLAQLADGVSPAVAATSSPSDEVAPFESTHQFPADLHFLLGRHRESLAQRRLHVAQHGVRTRFSGDHVRVRCGYYHTAIR